MSNTIDFTDKKDSIKKTTLLADINKFVDLVIKEYFPDPEKNKSLFLELDCISNIVSIKLKSYFKEYRRKLLVEKIDNDLLIESKSLFELEQNVLCNSLNPKPKKKH